MPTKAIKYALFFILTGLWISGMAAAQENPYVRLVDDYADALVDARKSVELSQSAIGRIGGKRSEEEYASAYQDLIASMERIAAARKRVEGHKENQSAAQAADLFVMASHEIVVRNSKALGEIERLSSKIPKGDMKRAQAYKMSPPYMANGSVDDFWSAISVGIMGLMPALIEFPPGAEKGNLAMSAQERDDCLQRLEERFPGVEPDVPEESNASSGAAILKQMLVKLPARKG